MLRNKKKIQEEMRKDVVEIDNFWKRYKALWLCESHYPQTVKVWNSDETLRRDGQPNFLQKQNH